MQCAIVPEALRSRLTAFVAMVLDAEQDPFIALGVLAAVIQGFGADLPQDYRRFLAGYLREIALEFEQDDEFQQPLNAKWN
jgi:hypothetical protein